METTIMGCIGYILVLYRVYTGVQVLGSRILGRGWGEFRIMAIQNYPVGVDPYTY